MIGQRALGNPNTLVHPGMVRNMASTLSKSVEPVPLFAKHGKESQLVSIEDMLSSPSAASGDGVDRGGGA